MMIINSTIKDFLKKKNSKGERTSDKDIKSLMKKERKKCQYHGECNKKHSEKQKQQLAECKINIV